METREMDIAVVITLDDNRRFLTGSCDFMQANVRLHSGRPIFVSISSSKVHTL